MYVNKYTTTSATNTAPTRGVHWLFFNQLLYVSSCLAGRHFFIRSRECDSRKSNVFSTESNMLSLQYLRSVSVNNNT